MTPTERAALEAVLRHMEPGENANPYCGTGEHHSVHECGTHIRAALRALLSSPPPAEPPLTCVKCSFFHGRVIGDCKHTPEVRTVQPTTPACPWFIAAALPASDERPSEEPALPKETLAALRMLDRVFWYVEARVGSQNHRGECVRLIIDRRGDDTLRDGEPSYINEAAERVVAALAAALPHPAAAPAPDEGRPQEKRLASEASLTVREPPDQGSMPTGCDGEGSRPKDRAEIDLEIERRLEAVLDASYATENADPGEFAAMKRRFHDLRWNFLQFVARTLNDAHVASRTSPASEAGGGETEGTP